MNKVIFKPLAVAISTAFVMTVSLSSCTTNPAPDTVTPSEQNQSSEDATRKAEEKKRAMQEKRAREMRPVQRPSGGCGS